MWQLFYFKMRQKFITKCPRFVITKCDSFIRNCDSYYKMRWFYYKMRQSLQNASFITKCVGTRTLKSFINRQQKRYPLRSLMLSIYSLLTFNYYFIYSNTDTIKVRLQSPNAKWKDLYTTYAHALLGCIKIVLAKMKRTFLNLNIYLLKLKHSFLFIFPFNKRI